MKNALYVALAFCAVFTMACSKKKDDPKPPPTALELLTSATWKIDTIAFDVDKDGEIDTPVPGGFAACDLDNTLSFSSDSTGVFGYGPLKCNDSETEPIDFRWTFKEDDTVINIDGMLPGGLTGDVDVLELTEYSFAFSRTITVPYNTNVIVKLMK